MGQGPTRRDLLALTGATALAKLFSISSAEAAELKQVALPELIKQITSGKDFLGLAESGTSGKAHKDISLSEFYSSPEFLASLKSAGFTKIGHEFFDTSMNSILRDYFDGKISDSAMEFFISQASPLALQGENQSRPDATSQIQKNLFLMIKGAKESGIRIEGISAYEGIADKNVIDPLLEVQQIASRALMTAIQEDERAFFDTQLSPETLRQFRLAKVDFYLQQAFEAHADKNPMLQKPEDREKLKKLFLAVYGLTDEKLDDDLDADLIKRLVLDRDVAKRVVAAQMRDGGGKMLVIYGNAHFLRSRGDIDFHVGDRRMPVLAITSDSGDPISKIRAALTQPGGEKFRPIFSRLERPEATLRLRSGKLELNDGTEIAVTAMPDLPSLKIPLPKKAPPKTKPLPP